MARVIGKARQQRGNTGTNISEGIIFLVLIGAVIGGLYYYFFIFRKSANYALGEFFGDVGAGDAKSQYAMLDNADKQFWPTEKKYSDDTSISLAHGYTERIENVTMQPAIIKGPGLDLIPTTLSVRSNMQHEALYQSGKTDTAKISCLMHQAPDGTWKIVISRSDFRQLLKITPNAPSSNF